MDNSDPLLSELCSICHINPPKYRCPRCSTRTCSLPCTRRHKLWSQCTGVRDPAAYLKRSEINESSFDRDFNFITGIERSLERADRDVENRGIDLARGQIEDDTDDTHESGVGQKRKRPQQSFVKGEAGFLRGAEAGAVNVLRAPRGMTRNKQNNSKWHPKHKCLSWSVEWISAGGEKVLRACLENCSIGGGYDRGFPLPKKEKMQAEGSEESKLDLQQGEGAATQEPTDAAATTTAQDTTESTTESADTKPEQPPSTIEAEKPTETTEGEKPPATEEETQDLPIVPHRDLYFYLHRPRTTVKKPVLVPLAPQKTLAASLRSRTVLEFPSIYALPDSPEKLLEEKETSPFMLEEEYLRTVGPEDAAKPESEQEDTENDSSGLQSGPDLLNLDEQHVLDVLKQDLFEAE